MPALPLLHLHVRHFPPPPHIVVKMNLPCLFGRRSPSSALSSSLHSPALHTSTLDHLRKNSAPLCVHHVLYILYAFISRRIHILGGKLQYSVCNIYCSLPWWHVCILILILYYSIYIVCTVVCIDIVCTVVCIALAYMLRLFETLCIDCKCVKAIC